MDILIEQPKGLKAIFRWRNLPYFLGGALVIFVVWLLFQDRSATVSVSSKTISVARVTEGEFNNYVRITGRVQPISTVQVSPLEGGVVASQSRYSR